MEETDLPPYIYQMRMLGYPPGYLEEAKVKRSGLSMYKGESDSGNAEREEQGRHTVVSC